MRFIALLAALLATSARAATLAPQALSLGGVTPTYNAAAAGGDTFVNDGRTYLHLKNGSGAAITVTIAAVPSFADNALGDVTLPNSAITVPAGGEKLVGILPPSRFNDVNGRANLSYSGVTSLGVAVIRTGKVY